MTAPRPFLTVDDLAAELIVTPQTVRRLLERGEIPGRKLGGTWRVSPEEWAAYRATFSRPSPRVSLNCATFVSRKVA